MKRTFAAIAAALCLFTAIAVATPRKPKLILAVVIY